jgi:lipid-A-disaccharide synthase-like uncharacterized protein
MITEILSQLQDPWVIFGFAAQGMFFGRFVVQWIATERAKRTVVPVSFWYLSIVGALMILAYAIRQQDIVFIFGQGLAIVIYLRNLYIFYQQPKESA